MFCEQCGKQINDDAKFCKYCGHSISGDEAEKTEGKKQKKEKKPKVKKEKGRGGLKKLLLKIFIAVFVGAAVFFGIKGYMTSRTVGQIPDPEHYFGMAADEVENYERVRRYIFRSEEDLQAQAEGYIEALASGDYPFDVTYDKYYGDGDFRYELEYTGGEKLWDNPLDDITLAYYAPNDNFTSMIDTHAVHISIYNSGNFEFVEAEQYDWSGESTEDNEISESNEEVDLNNVADGSDEVVEEEVQQTVEEEPQIAEPQVPALALPDLYAFIGGQGRQMDQGPSEGEVGEEYGYKMDFENGWIAANEYVELLANDPRFKLSKRPSAEEDAGTVLYLHTERYYFDYVGDEDIMPATGRYYSDGYQYFTADVGISMAKNGKEGYTSIVIWHSSDFNVTDLGDRASVAPSGASSSGGSSPDFNFTQQNPKRDCPYCNKGDCDKCGGDGYLHSSASDKDDRNCTAAYCRNGSCTYCDGRGWLE